MNSEARKPKTHQAEPICGMIPIGGYAWQKGLPQVVANLHDPNRWLPAYSELLLAFWLLNSLQGTETPPPFFDQVPALRARYFAAETGAAPVLPGVPPPVLDVVEGGDAGGAGAGPVGVALFVGAGTAPGAFASSDLIAFSRTATIMNRSRSYSRP